MEKTMRAALEAIGDGVLIIDSDDQVMYANEVFRKMWSIPAHVGTAEMGNCLESVVATDDKSYDLLERENGRLVERFLTPLLHHGGAEGRIYVFRDVTDRIQLDSELREANRALDRMSAGYRDVWQSVASVLRRLLVAQETLGAFTGVGDIHGWEVLDAVQLIARHAGIERTRRDRVQLRDLSDEIAAYAERLGRSVGTAVATDVDGEVFTDADVFVSGVVGAFLGFVLAVLPASDAVSITVRRVGGSPLSIAVTPRVPSEALRRLWDHQEAGAGALHAALLRAFAVVLGLELTIPEQVDVGTTALEVAGL